jgi:HAD superfamily hydrolase (TIGR01509 family)
MFTVLWDNDGVLVDTEGLYFQACKEVLGNVGIDLTLDQFKEISLRRGESTLVLATEQGVTADDLERLRQERDRMYAELMEAQSCVIDGAEEVLRVLHGQVRMGVVTSARRQHFEAAHGKCDLTRYMDFVLTREDYTQSKPHPEPYLTAMKRHGLSPDQCIIIEDSERGLAAATAAGVNCIIVLSQWTRDGDFSDALAVAEDIAEVLTLVLRHISAG